MPAAAFCFKVPLLPRPACPLSVIATVHPAVRLLLFAFTALAIQVVAPWACLAGLALLGLYPAGARRAWGLVRRARFLLLSLFLIFALGTPGVALLPGSDWLTREGVLLGLNHSLRLLAVLGAVAWLLASTPPGELAAGCYALLTPLGRLGWPTERAVARLLLVLRYGEQPLAPGAWKGLLRQHGEEEPATEALSLRLQPLGIADGAVSCAALGLLVASWWLA